MAQRSPTAQPGHRYRVVCYELSGEREEVVIDATGAGFIAATATIQAGVMDGELASAGPQALQEHIALMIANDDQIAGRSGHDTPR